eukprot:GHRR01032980.1.p1 GENE.GHRR01032980.1~~GHRR01032980.1.p1  ORF type:complete len:235 (-),score=54.88 GHRR01032980.1:35-739(-)
MGAGCCPVAVTRLLRCGTYGMPRGKCPPPVYCCVAVHAGGGDGALIFWIVGQAQAVAKVEGAHEGSLLGLAFHPLFALYTVGAIEACTKFWVRPRPGDPWRDAVQREQEEASSYADLLATATATAAATASAAGGAAGAAAVPGLGIGVPAQLPGGIAVQLPGIGATGGLGSIPGLGLLSCCLCPLCSYPSRCCSWPHCKATRHSPTKTTSRSTTTWGPSSNSSRRCCPASWPVP